MKISVVLVSVSLLTLSACATQAVEQNTNPVLSSLKSSYLDAGLSDSDFDKDLILGTRLAGMEYCGVANHETKTIANLVYSQRNISAGPQIGQTLEFGKQSALDIYKDAAKEDICVGVHQERLISTKMLLAENKLPSELDTAFLLPGRANLQLHRGVNSYGDVAPSQRPKTGKRDR